MTPAFQEPYEKKDRTVYDAPEDHKKVDEDLKINRRKRVRSGTILMALGLSLIVTYIAYVTIFARVGTCVDGTIVDGRCVAIEKPVK